MLGERRDSLVVEGESEGEVVGDGFVDGQGGQVGRRREGSSGEEEESGGETFEGGSVPDGFGVGGEFGELGEGVVEAEEKEKVSFHASPSVPSAVGFDSRKNSVAQPPTDQMQTPNQRSQPRCSYSRRRVRRRAAV